MSTRSLKLNKVVTLHSLRNQLKRDPDGYKDEFLLQLSQFRSIFNILKIRASGGASSTSRQTKDVSELIDFLAHTAPYYSTESADFPVSLIYLLENHLEGLQPVIRRNIVKALILLRNRHFVSPLDLLPVFFRLFRISDKALRKLVFSHIVQDIRRVNIKHKDLKLNTALQNFMYKMLQDENSTTVRKSLGVIMELYRKKVWQDAKTVNVLSLACFSKHSAVLRATLQFFLGEVVKADDDGDDEKTKQRNELNKAQAGMLRTKKKAKRRRVIERAEERLKKLAKKEEMHSDRDFSLIRSVYDPQTFTERLFSALKRSNEAFDIRVLYMNVISRFIGCHELEIFDFYSFLQKYMNPHQEYVTRILVYLGQACHARVPPDVLQPCIRKLADQFVTDRSSPEVIAVGLNSIREICFRQPLVMDETLLRDLTQYKSYKNKSVAVAARSIIQLFRAANPELLMKKDRGVPTGQTASEFGAIDIPSDIPGADILMKEILERQRNQSGSDDEDDWAPVPDTPLNNDSDDDDEDFEVVDLDDIEYEEDKDGEDEDEDEDQGSENEFGEGGISLDFDEETIAKEKKRQQREDEKSKQTLLQNSSENVNESDQKDTDEPDQKEIGEPEQSQNGDESDQKVVADEEVKAEVRDQGAESNANKNEVSSSSSEKSQTTSRVKKKPLPASAAKIFTPRELKRLEEIRKQKAIRGAKSRGQKQITLIKHSDQVTTEFAIQEDDIVSFGLKRKMNDDGEEKDKKKFKFEAKKDAGTTNEDKRRNNPFHMTLYSRSSRRKRARSFGEKEAVHRRHISKIKNHSHKRKRTRKNRPSKK